MKARLYFIDWLRVFVILSLIPYHAALTYTGLGDIYIKQTVSGMSVVPFIFVTMPLDNFFMTLLFFISGMSSFYSMSFRGAKSFVRERVKKLFIPFLLGTIFLCPVQAYSMALYNGYKASLPNFFREFFSMKIVDYLGYAHLWFLLYLFVFSIICKSFFQWCFYNKNRITKFVEWLIDKQHIYIPLLWVIAIEAILRPYFPGMQILIFDWANDLVYLSVFIFGFIFAFDSRIQHRIDRIFRKSIIIVGLSLVCLFLIYYHWLVLNEDFFILARLWAVIKGFYEVFFIVLLMIAGRRYFNVSNKTLEYLKGSSFTFYMSHLLVVTYITLFVVNLKINVYVKYSITVIVSLLVVVFIDKILRAIRKKKTKKLRSIN